MTIKNKFNDEKLHNDIKREAAKISVLSSGKNDKYKFLTGEKILPSDRSRIIEQAKSTYYHITKAFEKQIKLIGDQGMKQVGALKALKSEKNQEQESIEGLFPKNMRNIESKNEINDIKKNWNKN